MMAKKVAKGPQKLLDEWEHLERASLPWAASAPSDAVQTLATELVAVSKHVNAAGPVERRR